ncbi:MAG: inositol monophosphatase family protein [Beijerinckiaceae bacterium]
MITHDVEVRYLAALGLAQEAGAVAMSYFTNRDRLGVSMKGAQDWLTAADGAVEKHLRARIAAAFPNDGVLGEEMGLDAAAAKAEHLWVIDPIDGTANFARAHPHWCISIGVLRNGVPEAGVIAAPVMGVTWAGRRGGGATRNGEPIRVSEIDDLRRAAVEIGWSKRRPDEDYLDVVRKVMAAGAAPKRCGSGALGLAFVADGRSEGYLEAHINSWDVAAGVVIVAEAGGVVNDFFAGDGLTAGKPILAAPPALAGELSGMSGIQL